MKKIIALALIGLAITALNAFGQTTADEWSQRGSEYSRNGDYTNAITAFSESIKLDSSKKGTFYLRANAYYQIKNYDAAISDCNIVIKDNPTRTQLRVTSFLRANAYYQIKNYDAAIADCDIVIKIVPDSSDGYIRRSDAYGAKGIYHKAVVDYKIGLEKGYDPSVFIVDKSSKADMWFLSTLYMEIAVNRFLGKSDVVAKYENWLKTVSDKNKVTR